MWVQNGDRSPGRCPVQVLCHTRSRHWGHRGFWPHCWERRDRAAVERLSRFLWRFPYGCITCQVKSQRHAKCPPKKRRQFAMDTGLEAIAEWVGGHGSQVEGHPWWREFCHFFACDAPRALSTESMFTMPPLPPNCSSPRVR